MARTPDSQPTRGEPSGSSRKALRIGIFLAGKPLEERLVRRPQDVYVGPADGNTIIIPPVRGLPTRFALFHATATGYELCFTEKMSGQLIQADESVSLAQLIDDGAEQRGEVYRVMLDPEARGEVRLGDLKVLFQFVTPPALVPRPQLPLSLRGSFLQTVDRRLLQIAAASFVVHFAFVVYLRAMERPPQPDIEEIPDRFVKMLIPKKVEPPQPIVPKKVEVKKTEPKPEDPKKPATPTPAPKKVEDPEAIARAEAAQKERMAQTMAHMGVLHMLTSKGPDGALADAMNKGESADPDKVFSQVGGIGPATGQPGLGTARGGDGTGQTKTVGPLVASGPTEGIGTGEKTEKKVHAIVQESAPQDIDPIDLDPKAVADKIRQYRGALVACYENALKRNAGLAGKITLRFSISKLGKVSNIEIEVDTMHDDDFSKCIIERASNWRFPAPKSGSEEVQFAYPFIFQSSK